MATECTSGGQKAAPALHNLGKLEADAGNGLGHGFTTQQGWLSIAMVAVNSVFIALPGPIG